MEFRSNGKILLSGEYFIIDGAKAIGIPCNKGQRIKINKIKDEDFITWESYDNNKMLWFKSKFDIKTFEIINCGFEYKKALVIKKIFETIKKINPKFEFKPVKIKSFLEFDLNWGLGSSSTLINNFAMWTNSDPYELLKHTFGGSGYDIACANSSSPIQFQKIDNKINILPVKFNPPFINNLLLVHLNKKVNSKSEIEKYSVKKKPNNEIINNISKLSEKLIKTEDQNEFNKYIDEHENIVADHLKKARIKKTLFKDFDGEIKSLGAWGGDLILVSSFNKKEALDYFKKNKYNTIMNFTDLLIQ